MYHSSLTDTLVEDVWNVYGLFNSCLAPSVMCILYFANDLYTVTQAKGCKQQSESDSNTKSRRRSNDLFPVHVPVY